MKEIAVVDYGMCNLDSVARAVEKCGGVPLITDDPAVIGEADGIILPGVGAFADAMHNLAERELVPVLRRQTVERVVPFLGICLGMQLMAGHGHEGGTTAGLGLIPGEVIRFSANCPDRIPHVGWNQVEVLYDCPLFDGISDRTDFYFVHSYHFDCPPQYAIARTPYCSGFVSVVGKGRCFGTQFHPEKSLGAGQALLRNFLALC